MVSVCPDYVGEVIVIHILLREYIYISSRLLFSQRRHSARRIIINDSQYFEFAICITEFFLQKFTLIYKFLE